MAANSALPVMLSARTFRDASASRRARSRVCVSLFMRSTARRMYAARESFSATAQRLLASSRSSGSLSEIALIDMPPEHPNRVSGHDIRMAAMVNPDVAGRVLTFARGRGQRGYEARALRLLGEITAHRDPRSILAATTSTRWRSPEELGMRPLVAHCHLGLGQ